MPESVTNPPLNDEVEEEVAAVRLSIRMDCCAEGGKCTNIEQPEEGSNRRSLLSSFAITNNKQQTPQIKKDEREWKEITIINK